ncbi:hypothetical protein ASJ36_20310 [Aeromonas sp. ARM81]|nr:hypothetical protein ASJ36_20310 [Aeromonas sp. ARM81]
MAGIIFGGARGVVGGSETLKRGGRDLAAMDAGEMAQKRTRGWHHDDASPLLCMVFPTGVEPVACPLGVQKLLVSYRISWFYMKYFFD